MAPPTATSGITGSIPGEGMIYPGWMQVDRMAALWFSLEVTDAEFAELIRLHSGALERIQALAPARWATTRALLQATAEYPLNVERTRSLWRQVQDAREAVFGVQLELGQQVRQVLGETRWTALQARWQAVALDAQPQSGGSPQPSGRQYADTPREDGGMPPGAGIFRPVPRSPGSMPPGPGPRSGGQRNPGPMGGGFEFHLDADGKPPPPPPKWQ